jgi:hypothetical protein
MGGLPPDALDVLVRTMARVCENPYDRLFSMAVRDEDPQERMAELGDTGLIQFTVDEEGSLEFVPDLDVYLEHAMCSCNASDDNPY